MQLGAAAAGGVKVTKSPPLLYPPSTSNFPLPFAHLLPTFCPPSAHLRCRTFDPEEADYFFVPTMAGCIFDMYGWNPIPMWPPKLHGGCGKKCEENVAVW